MSRGAMDSIVITIVGAAFLALLLVAAVGTAQRAVGQPQLKTNATGSHERIAAVVDMPAATETPISTNTPAPTQTPAATPTATIVPTDTPAPSPTATTTAEPTTATDGDNTSGTAPEPPAATPHFWLSRPIGPDAVDTVARFYPYASTGEGQYDVHHGVEFVNEAGTPVIAVGPGRIVFAGTDEQRVVGPATNFYGNVIVQELDRRWEDKPLYVVYGHLSSIMVESGQRVEPGDQIGLVGMSGIALGPHLHFEVRVGGATYADTRNPQLWLQPPAGHGIVVGQILDVQGRPVPETLVSLHEPDSDDVAFFEYTYAEGSVNADEEWNENLLIGDVPAGQYRVAARIGDQTRAALITVREGEITFVRLQARPVPTATSGPPPTATSASPPTEVPAEPAASTPTPAGGTDGS